MKKQLSVEQIKLLNEAVKITMDTFSKKTYYFHWFCYCYGLFSCFYSLQQRQPSYFIESLILIAIAIFLYHLFLSRTQDYITKKIEYAILNKKDPPLPEWICAHCAMLQSIDSTVLVECVLYRNQCDLCNEVQPVVKVIDLNKFNIQIIR